MEGHDIISYFMNYVGHGRHFMSYRQVKCLAILSVKQFTQHECEIIKYGKLLYAMGMGRYHWKYMRLKKNELKE